MGHPSSSIAISCNMKGGDERGHAYPTHVPTHVYWEVV